MATSVQFRTAKEAVKEAARQQVTSNLKIFED